MLARAHAISQTLVASPVGEGCVCQVRAQSRIQGPDLGIDDIQPVIAANNPSFDLPESQLMRTLARIFAERGDGETDAFGNQPP